VGGAEMVMPGAAEGVEVIDGAAVGLPRQADSNSATPRNPISRFIYPPLIG
jgi:hypothetical protein